MPHPVTHLSTKSPYRDAEELLVERGVAVDHVTVYRCVQRFTPLFAAACPLRHAAGDRWFVDETCVKVAGRCRQLLDRSVASRSTVDRARRPCQPRSAHRAAGGVGLSGADAMAHDLPMWHPAAIPAYYPPGTTSLIVPSVVGG
jgi:hypothetical protein